MRTHEAQKNNPKTQNKIIIHKLKIHNHMIFTIIWILNGRRSLTLSVTVVTALDNPPKSKTELVTEGVNGRQMKIRHPSFNFICKDQIKLLRQSFNVKQTDFFFSKTHVNTLKVVHLLSKNIVNKLLFLSFVPTHSGHTKNTGSIIYLLENSGPSVLLG